MDHGSITDEKFFLYEIYIYVICNCLRLSVKERRQEQVFWSVCIYKEHEIIELIKNYIRQPPNFFEHAGCLKKNPQSVNTGRLRDVFQTFINVSNMPFSSF